MIVLGLLREVIPSNDGLSVSIGGGAKWVDVSKVLDENGLAVVGGRNSPVGVGGSTLGGNDFLPSAFCLLPSAFCFLLSAFCLRFILLFYTRPSNPYSLQS